jgi:superfamily II DNA or RNA helicase
MFHFTCKKIIAFIYFFIHLTLFVELLHGSEMALVLRPYQETVKAQIYEAWKTHRNVLLQLPTGGGKTKTFCSISIDIAISGITGQQLPTAIMVHRKELVQQISLTLAEEGIPHNIIAPRNVILGIVAAQRQLLKKQFYDYNATVTVISVDTLNARIMKHEKWAKSIKLWICDEAAHLLKNNKWGRAVAYFPNAIGLGVTATPERLDKRGLGSHVDGVFDTMVAGPSTQWLIENGHLCKYKIAIPQSDYSLYLKEAAGDSDYTREAMIVASQKSKIVGDVVSNYEKFAKGKQAIVFASDIGAGERMEKKFLEAGIKAKLLTGLTEDSVRFNSLMDYRDKKIQVLINVDLFDEGLDVPGIECVIMARPTMSLSKYLQMVGRGLRVAKDKPYLILIDHVGNVKKHGLPDMRRKWSLDRVTRRKKKLNLIRICANPACNSPFDRVLTQCPYCGTKIIVNAGSGSGRVSPTMVDGDLTLLDPDTLRELEASTRLEAPESVAQRVAKAAGGPAGIRAMHNQIERIETQKKLVEVVALMAGRMRSEGLSDREIHKAFFIEHETTISEILAKPKAEMLSWIEELGGET